MIDINALKAEWVKVGLRQKDVAELIGMTPKTFSLQLKKGVLGSDTKEELIKKLEIKNPIEIFFAS